MPWLVDFFAHETNILATLRRSVSYLLVFRVTEGIGVTVLVMLDAPLKLSEFLGRADANQYVVIVACGSFKGESSMISKAPSPIGVFEL